MMQLCDQIIHNDLGWTYYKMSISEKVKAINNKIEQNKAYYNLQSIQFNLQKFTFLLFHQEM